MLGCLAEFLTNEQLIIIIFLSFPTFAIEHIADNGTIINSYVAQDVPLYLEYLFYAFVSSFFVIL